MPGYRYSRWDGTQDDPLGPDLDVPGIVDALSDELLEGGDPAEAIDRLMRRGLPGRFGGLDAIRQRLREARLAAQQEGRLDGVLEQAREELDAILENERAELSFRDDPEARMREGFLESLPPDPAGRIGELKEYDFVSPVAAERFKQLLLSLIHI